MSKRMIDSEVSERIKYRWDDDVEQSYIDIDADNLNVPGYINSSGFSTSGSMEPAAIAMEIEGNYRSMNGGQIGNIPLYYHCVKLTSATKTVYVNICSKDGNAVDNAQKWVNVIIGNKTSPNNIDWYYGTDGHVVHSVWKSLFNRVETTIDGEEVTAYEGHVNGVFPDRYVVVR